MNKKGFVYLMTNKTRTVLYTGVTSNLLKRVWEHKKRVYPGSFASRYNVDILVYFEEWPTIKEAIIRETEIKKWRREKKNWLIEKDNKYWEEIKVF